MKYQCTGAGENMIKFPSGPIYNNIDVLFEEYYFKAGISATPQFSMRNSVFFYGRQHEIY